MKWYTRLEYVGSFSNAAIHVNRHSALCGGYNLWKNLCGGYDTVELPAAVV